ncbi:MAG: ABC transporter ATP-binding protein [Gemmatimonadota bacterium]
MKAADALLRVRGLHVSYRRPGARWGGRERRVRAVRGVDLEILRGETLGLVGESGSGKSTLARALLRLVAPEAGSVIFDGVRIEAMQGEGLRRFRRRAQMVFQDPYASLNPRLSAGNALREVLRVHGLGGVHPDGRVAELLELVGLSPDHAGRYPHEFSGGQRQRLGIARALSVEPDFLILDEPVSALDVSIQAQIINLLADLQERFGLTYLFIAHDLALVETVGDRVAVMLDGRIVEVADRAELYEKPLHPYTKALLGAAPRPDPRARRLRTLPVVETEAGTGPAVEEGCSFYLRCQETRKDATCRAIAPPLEEREDGHRVACHHPSARDGDGG